MKMPIIFVWCFSSFLFAGDLNWYLEKSEYRYFQNLQRSTESWNSVVRQHEPKKALFLGDKKEKGSYSLGHVLAKQFKTHPLQIWTTDLFYSDRDFARYPNLHQRRLNHQERFDFDDDFFDVVVGRRLLCHCEDRETMMTCGGLPLEDFDCTTQFFNEVARVLNSENPFAFAFIHGLEPRNYRQKEVKIVYEKVGLALNVDFNFYILRRKKTERRFAILISQKTPREIFEKRTI